jgi:hypothetical protein
MRTFGLTQNPKRLPGPRSFEAARVHFHHNIHAAGLEVYVPQTTCSTCGKPATRHLANRGWCTPCWKRKPVVR